MRQCFNVKIKLKFAVEYKRLSPRYYLSMDAVFGMIPVVTLFVVGAEAVFRTHLSTVFLSAVSFYRAMCMHSADYAVA